ncbi:MAG: hypothetical protein RR342_03780 [Bacilli bacterium]
MKSYKIYKIQREVYSIEIYNLDLFEKELNSLVELLTALKFQDKTDDIDIVLSTCGE